MTGLVVASLLNVDSIEIASALYSDTHLRLSVATQAEAEGQVPIARRAADKGPNVMSIPIESGTLPLGWENSRFASRAQWAERAWAEPSFWFGPVLMKILGLLVTALAGSLGAAFWFDACVVCYFCVRALCQSRARRSSPRVQRFCRQSPPCHHQRAILGLPGRDLRPKHSWSFGNRG